MANSVNIYCVKGFKDILLVFIVVMDLIEMAILAKMALDVSIALMALTVIIIYQLISKKKILREDSLYVEL